MLLFPFGKAYAQPFSYARLIQALSGIKTVSADVSIDTSGKTVGKSSGIFASTGKLYAVLPDHLRMDMEVRPGFNPGGSGVAISTRLIFDGKTLWLTARSKSSLHPAIFLDVAKLEKDNPEFFRENKIGWLNNPVFDLAELEEGSLKFLGMQRSPAGNLFIVEGRLKKQLTEFFGVQSFGLGRSSQPAQMRLWVGARNGVTYRALMLSDQGKTLGRMQLSNVALNQLFGEMMFQESFPKNVTPIDITPMVEKNLPDKNFKQSSGQ